MKSKMTIRDIAGFCPEEAVWKMMADVSTCLMKENAACCLSPDSVMIDGDMFMIEVGEESAGTFLAPEHADGQNPDDKETVWALGAVAYFAATGHVVFGGYGGRYQKEHPSVQLPVLPKGMGALTTVLQKCLCYKPEERIGLREVNALSMNGLADCKKQQRKKVIAENIHEQRKEVKYAGEKWPEEMTEV